MNIWIFNHHAASPNMPGGTRHFDLARELTRRGHHISIFASASHYFGGLQVKLDESETFKIQVFEGVRFVWLKTFGYERNDWRRILGMISYWVQSLRIGRRLRNRALEDPKPDIVVGSSVHLLAVLAAVRVARRYKAKFVMEVRDLWPQTLVDLGALGKRHPVLWILRALERRLYRRAERIITLLPHADRYIKARGGIPEKIVWIPNGVDLSRFSNFESPQAGRDRFIAMYLGAHGPTNALEVILQAADLIRKKGCNDIRFMLIGSGSMKSHLIELADRLKLNNLEFLNPIEKDRVPRILGLADVCLFNLEKTEVFKYGISSNKLFDYMAAAKPVVFSVEASNNPVREAECGLSVPPRDPKALSEAILRLHGMSHEARKALGLRGRRYVERHHDWRILAERFEGMLKSLLTH